MIRRVRPTSRREISRSRRGTAAYPPIPGRQVAVDWVVRMRALRSQRSPILNEQLLK